ncbi:hypothetical protein WJX74_004071 [Apatococcus lobatus]|uniref:ESCRT-II complex subunit VPS25 n=1 Tax=Apatococcus lobatus TaxID=904363 RepID=A0AAW1RXZ9_9CHLO
MAGANFSFPVFHSYPPYFTLQPVKETREKQSALWKDLILKYCKQHKIFKLSTDTASELELFHNRGIDRQLSPAALDAFLSELVAQGNAQWLDSGHHQCLILWKRLDEWAAALLEWARSSGMEDSVTTVEELLSGDEVRGTELEGVPRELMQAMLRFLEKQGRARLFKGSTADDEGVKFFL